MRKIFVSVAFACSMLLVACDSDNAENSGNDSSHPSEISVGYLPIADCAQLFVGIEKGFFSRENISIKPLVLASGVKILEATATKDIDIGFSALAPLILARSKGIDIVALTGGPAEDQKHPEHALLVKDDSPIRDVHQLEGKTIGLVAFRSIDEVFVKEWLARNDIDVQKVNFLEIPFPQMEPTLLTGAVDAVAAIEPFVTVAKINNKTRVLGHYFVDVQPVVEISSYNTRRDWAEEHPETIKQFRRAFEKATHYANLHPEETRSIITKYIKLDPAIANIMALPLFNYRLSIDSLQSIAGLMIKWQIINNNDSIQNLIYP